MVLIFASRLKKNRPTPAKRRDIYPLSLNKNYSPRSGFNHVDNSTYRA
ncbi:hypothetical protein J415_14340 [Klebsiella michiganensis HKOPL1]|uniref:Uncharacterized protein n=1 Tax=Klebsiella michiganensis (strain ATCC 8724 / DSM 4798 / JCM 20051 / NBRC 3318 / NRRL B-199 / KCTC 1686 / BUCSAV 143 / CCM 1901) TaxID=1006551 RepID=A0A0H3HAT5_KLEM8|nr:hypothetical protein KOX_23305 [Klebsiella michiganensis KCTC 1686]AHW88344.1 hypothetical protein J415_14340 [Klebsiella michiganensis HKOPL1]